MADLVVFISYRRSDASADARGLYDGLRRRYGRENVFMDVDSLRPGRDWVDAIEGAVKACDVFLVLIGPDWASATDEEGHRRLEDEGDRVRLEIEAALAEDKPVIPILVDGAAVPRRSDLPPSLHPLLRRQSHRLSHATYSSDLRGLLAALREIERELAKRDEPLGTALAPEPARDAVAEPPVSSEPVPAAASDAASDVAAPPAMREPDPEPVPAAETVVAPADPVIESLPPSQPPPPTSVHPPPPAQMQAPAQATPAQQVQPPNYQVSPPASPVYPLNPVYQGPPPYQGLPTYQGQTGAAGPPNVPYPGPVSGGTGGNGRRRLALIAVVGLSVWVVIIIAVFWRGGSTGTSTGGSPSPRPPTPRVTPTRPPPTQTIAPLRTIKLGIAVPVSEIDGAGTSARDAVLFAIKRANEASTIPGYRLEGSIRDDAVSGLHNPEQGAINMEALVADTAVLAVVGPMHSNVARLQIPISNEADLVQCGPTTAVDDLTKDGSEDYRFNGQDRRSFIRVWTLYSVLPPAMADFSYNDLGARSAYVLDDGDGISVAEADAFSSSFTQLGGSVVAQETALVATTDYVDLFTTASALGPDVVFFGGTALTGGGEARRGMVEAGMGGVPFTGTEAIGDLQAGGVADAFITLAGVENSYNVYAALSGLTRLPADTTFDEAAYEAEFGEPPGAFSRFAYACAEVLIGAIRDTAALADGDLAAWRGAVRDHIFDATTEHTYPTAIGPIGFDLLGDIEPPAVSYFRVDPELSGGDGDWVFVSQTVFDSGLP